MLTSESPLRHWSQSPVVQIGVALCAGGAMGGVLVLFPPALAVAGLAGLVLLPVFAKRPEMIVLGIMLALSTIIDPESLPAVPGYESIKVTDIALAVLLGLIVVRWLAERDFHVPPSPVVTLLLVFFGYAMLTTALAWVMGRVELWAIFEEVRIVANYLLCVVVMALVRTEKQLFTLIRGMLALATFVSGAMVLQFVLGNAVAILPGRVEVLATQGSVFEEVTRILPPGQSVILTGCLTLTVILVLRRLRVSSFGWFVLWGLMMLAVILTFNRSFWVGTGLGIGILATQVRGASWQRFITWAVLVALTVLVVLGLLSTRPELRITQLANASVDRLLTLFTGGGATSDASFQWRYPEYEHGVPVLLDNPVLGVGLGTAYRPFDPRVDRPESPLTRYAHNGHLWIAMKTGMVGYLLLMTTITVYLVRGFTYWRRVENPLLAGAVLGFALTTTGTLLANIVAPIFMQWYWAPVLGAMMGISELIIARYAGVSQHGNAVNVA